MPAAVNSQQSTVNSQQSTIKPVILPADLSILFLSRAPRYNRYCLDYSHNAPELCVGTANEKRFPEAGEPITFTARIANQGDIATTAVGYTWTLDGVSQAVGMLPALGASSEITLTWGWAWQTGAHTVTLEMGDGGNEITLANNRLDQRTDAHYLEILVHPYFVQAFRNYRNLAGSYSFADWLQAQFAQMNERLAGAITPDTPNGLPDRIRIDVITSTTTVGGDTVFGDLAYDGRWTFRTERNYKDTPEDEAWESAQNYARTFANGIDWGLIHELTHQLGIIDLYQLNVSPSAGNLVNDRQGWPLLSGFYWQFPDLMGGDDVRPYDGSYYSPHTARGLRSNSGRRRGYFGEYLFDLPDQVRVQVLDRSGHGVANARIEAYQSEGGVVRAQPVFKGDTDSAGLFALPNRPVSPTLTTATGHSLRPNPFGLIDVVGQNGQLLLRVLKNGSPAQEFFSWLTITELNKLAWRGERAVTLTLPTHFPAAGATPPLAPPLQVHTAGSEATLDWPSVAGAVSYNIYQGLWPEYYPFQPLATGVTTTTYTALLSRSTRFAVTAVGADGVESGFGPVARAELLYVPRGLVWEPTSALSARGQLLVIDGHPGSLLRLLPPTASKPPAWVGRVGSEHIGMVGAVAATRTAQGVIGVALAGQWLWLLDDQQRIVNWIGRVGDLPAPLDQPAGLALAGEPFTVTVPLARPDPSALLLVPFDGSLADPNGIAPTRAENVRFVPGRFGQAVAIEEGSALQYAAPGPDFLRQGSVEFWVRPDWPGKDKHPHILLEIGDPTCPETTAGCYRLRLAQEDGWLYAWATDFDDLDKAAWGMVAAWQPGQWHHIAAAWNDQRLNLHIDGRLAWGEALRVPISGTATTIALGGALSGGQAANAAFDSLRLSRFPRLGNSDRVRVVVSEPRLQQLRVLDLMGNQVSTWAPDDDLPAGIHQFGQLALAADGTLWLADGGPRLLHQFDLAHDTPRRLRTLGGFAEDAPQALAASDAGLLAVAAGNQVHLLDPNLVTPLLATWAAPNDGSPGPFRQPVALAFGPDGDLAVGEAGNQRVSFIQQPSRGRVWLPRVIRQP